MKRVLAEHRKKSFLHERASHDPSRRVSAIIFTQRSMFNYRMYQKLLISFTFLDVNVRISEAFA